MPVFEDQEVRTRPIKIGYAWPGVRVNFPAGLLGPSDTLRADLRLLPNGEGVPLTCSRDGDAVDITGGEELAAELQVRTYRSELIWRPAGLDDVPTGVVLLVPVKDSPTRPAS